VTDAAKHRGQPQPATAVAFGSDAIEIDIHLDIDDETLVMPGLDRAFPVARVMSLFMLGVVSFALFHIGRAGYYLATDVQIAPFLLTPDSDAITTSRLSMASLTTEREAAGAHRQVLEQQLVVTRESLQRLKALHARVESAVGVAEELTVHSEKTSQQELAKLRGQKVVIDGALAEQTRYISQTSQRVESGLAHAADLVRERAELRRLKLLQLERERDQVAAENHVRELSISKASHHGASEKTTPDVLRLQEQLVRLELELRALEADERGKVAELEATNAQTARLDALIVQLQQRPLYRAIASKQTLAFVPYTQLRSVRANASIYECRLWSAFFCQYVGRISELLPGEINATDPWGSPARGEYAVMELSEPRAVTAKTLRVREREQSSNWSWAAWKYALSNPTETSQTSTAKR
jgi:hypothetical protein